ncbi:hypothetical protein U1Q18_021393 [Sarracenia purpurea var. burkii]
MEEGKGTWPKVAAAGKVGEENGAVVKGWETSNILEMLWCSCSASSCRRFLASAGGFPPVALFWIPSFSGLVVFYPALDVLVSFSLSGQSCAFAGWSSLVRYPRLTGLVGGRREDGKRSSV